MIVEQIYANNVFFRKKMFEKYKLEEYYDKNKPAIFNGIYDDVDFDSLKNHTSYKIVVWCGTDAQKLINFPKNIEIIKSLKDIKHISKSHFVYESLLKCGIESEIIPVTPTKIIKNRQDRGDKIYFYTSNSLRKKERYGQSLLPKIKERINMEIIEAYHTKYNSEELNNIYKQCFIGLRLTKHDGLPNTVVELGLMGRKCIYNGKLPNAIPYKNIDDIIRIINEEYEKRHKDNEYIVDEVFNYLNIDDSWMKI